MTDWDKWAQGLGKPKSVATRKPAKPMANTMANSTMANTGMANTYRYRDQAKRKAYMREYMRKRRLSSASH